MADNQYTRSRPIVKLLDAMIIMLVLVLLAIFGLIFGSSDQARQKITE